MPRTPTVDGRKNQKPAGQEKLDAFEEVISSLRPDQMRSVRALISMLAGKDICEQEKQEVFSVLRQVLAASGNVLREVSHPAGTYDRVRVYREKVGEQVFRHRRAAGLTQTELAKISGIPQSHISRIEAGKFAPTFSTMSRIATALGVQAKELDPGFSE